MLHTPVNTIISFVLMITIVGGSFYYVSALAPRGPWIGIDDGVYLNPARAQALQLDQDHGILIYTIVPSSPAAKAGMQEADDEVVINEVVVPIGGDIIVSIDGLQINGPEDVCRALTPKQVGDTMLLEIDRDGSLQVVNLILEEAPPGKSPEC